MLRFLTAGESHGPCLTAIVEGLPAGLPVDEEAINRDLRRRQSGYGRGGRMQIERDQVEVLGGVWQGKATGAPVPLRIENRDWVNWRDRVPPPQTVPRPGHADHAGMVKYGFEDARRVAERASARETAARVAVGGLAKLLLAEFDIGVGGFVVEIGDVIADEPDRPPEQIWALAEANDMRCPDEAAAARMRVAIDAAREQGDSLGGIMVIMANPVPIGLGSHVHWDRRLDGRLAAAIMSIPAIKGVEIGQGIASARLPGTQVHDEIFPAEGHRATLRRRSNRAGGLEGGMTNGQPVVVRAAMKPIPTTVTPLRSVDMSTGKPAKTQYQRSDVCAVPAAVVVGEAMMAWVLASALMEKLGGDSLGEMKAHFESGRMAGERR
jgi:chorismate synthase